MFEMSFPDGNVFHQDISNWDFGVPPDSLVMSAQEQAFVHIGNNDRRSAYMCMLDKFCHLGHLCQVGGLLYASTWHGSQDSRGLNTTDHNCIGRGNGAMMSPAESYVDLKTGEKVAVTSSGSVGT